MQGLSDHTCSSMLLPRPPSTKLGDDLAWHDQLMHAQSLMQMLRSHSATCMYIM